MTSPIEKLGDLLVRQGLISASQFSECLKEHQARGPGADAHTLGEIILSHGTIDRVTMSRSLEAVGAPPPPAERPPAPSGGLPAEVIEARRDPKRLMGKYTLVCELGRGGMAVVYKAWDEALQKFVALKLIRTRDLGLADASKEGDVQEFLREARTAVKLTHPNIVRIYELGCHEDRHYLSMEYIEGHTLEQLLHPDGKRASRQEFYSAPRRFLVILKDIALALDHAHRQQPAIIHRDIKPQNILVDDSGRACVVDFGLAKEMRPGNTLTLNDIVKGTPRYMAPEQALGRDGGGVDAQSDVWALGVILYECLAGAPPFTGSTSREILNKVVNEEPLRPSEVQERKRSGQLVVPDLERICLKALQKDKSRRYHSAREFADEIDRFFSGESVRARHVKGYERVWRRVAKNKGAAVAVTVAVLMGFVAAASFIRSRNPERIVERVTVESGAEARLREACEKVRLMTSELQLDQAAKGYRELLSMLEEGKDRDALRGQLEEVRLQEVLLAELIVRIQEKPRDFARFELRDATLTEARLLDATRHGLTLRYEGKPVQVPWGKVAPAQFSRLTKTLGPQLPGEAMLGFVAWSVHHSLRGEALAAAEPLRDTPQEIRAREILARAGIPWPPLPVAKPVPAPVVVHPDPPPLPAIVPVTAVPETRPAPAPRRESPLPPLETLAYRQDWKHHGYALAEALSLRGWDDLAQELVLNSMIDPAAAAAHRAQGILVLAQVRAARASRESSLPDRIRLLDWAVQGAREFIQRNPGHALQGRAQAELSIFEGLRGQALARAGDAESAVAALEASEASLKVSITNLEAARKLPTDPGYAAWLHELLSTRYRAMLNLLAKVDILRVLKREPARIRALHEVRRQMTEEYLWRAEGTPLGYQGLALLGGVCLLLAQSADPEEANAHWSDALICLKEARTLQGIPPTLRSPAIRTLVGRIALMELCVLNAHAEHQSGTAGTQTAVETLKVLKEFERSIPGLRSGDLEAPMLLEEARALELSGQFVLSAKKLEGQSIEAIQTGDPREAELAAARAALPGLQGKADAPTLARAWSRLGEAYYVLGRITEAAAVFATLDDPAFRLADKKLLGDAALKRLVCLKRIQVHTHAAADTKAFEEYSQRAQKTLGTLATPSGPAFLELLDAHRRMAPSRSPSIASPAPLALLHALPVGGEKPLGLTQPSRAYAQRKAPLRGPAALRGGLDAQGEAAVLASLRWLARHQSPEGSWKTTDYIAECKKLPSFAGSDACTPNPGGAFGDTIVQPPFAPFKCGDADPETASEAGLTLSAGDPGEVGVTGLALLAFLGAGYTHQSPETFDGVCFGDVIRKGLLWVLGQQVRDGCIGPRSASKYMIGHLICAYALAEAHGMTGSVLMRDEAQKAVHFTIAAQNPGKGWRYSLKCGDNDTVVTGWAMLGLHAAQLSGLSVSQPSLNLGRLWLASMMEDNYGRAGYTDHSFGKIFVPGMNEHFDHHEALSAVAATCRVFLDRFKTDSRHGQCLDLLMRDPPKWEGNATDFFYWHWGSLAAFQLDGAAGSKWKIWNTAVKTALLNNQNLSAAACKHGSWEPVDRWSSQGGRIYATALNTLTLLTSVRYPPTFDPAKK